MIKKWMSKTAISIEKWLGGGLEERGVCREVCYKTWAYGTVATLTIAGDVILARYLHMLWNNIFREGTIVEKQ